MTGFATEPPHLLCRSLWLFRDPDPRQATNTRECIGCWLQEWCSLWSCCSLASQILMYELWASSRLWTAPLARPAVEHIAFISFILGVKIFLELCSHCIVRVSLSIRHGEGIKTLIACFDATCNRSAVFCLSPLESLTRMFAKATSVFSIELGYIIQFCKIHSLSLTTSHSPHRICAGGRLLFMRCCPWP